MSWVKLDDQFPDHPKVVAAGSAAAWLFVCGLSYCSRLLTDGFIPRGQVRRLTDAKTPDRLADQLVKVGLWETADGGFRVHDYLVYQPSREQIEAGRSVARRRSAMNADERLAAEIKARDGSRCRYCLIEVNWRDRKSPQGGTYDHVTPLSTGGTEAIDNLVVCCRACNMRKGIRTPESAGMVLYPPPDLAKIKTESRRNLDQTQTTRTPSPNGGVSLETPPPPNPPTGGQNGAAMVAHYVDLVSEQFPAIRDDFKKLDPELTAPWLRKALGGAEARAGPLSAVQVVAGLELAILRIQRAIAEPSPAYPIRNLTAFAAVAVAESLEAQGHAD
jgi:hypothetical protein